MSTEMQNQPTRIEANKAIVQRWMESLSSGNLDVADELLAANFVGYIPGLPGPIHGVEAFKQFASTFSVAFPNLHYAVEEEIAAGDKVVIRWTLYGTHKGVLTGIPPTGKQVKVEGVNIYRIASGKIVEQWSDTDRLGMLQQLGIIPPMG